MQEDEFEIEKLLQAIGMGVALVGRDGAIRTSNATFDSIVARAPAAVRALCLSVRFEQRAVERLLFEPGLGWMRWQAHPLDGGIALQVCKATEQEVRLARLASQAGEDALGLPNRDAMNAELVANWDRLPGAALMVVAPATRLDAMPVSRDKAEAAFVAIVAHLSARLLEHEGVFRLAPLSLGVIARPPHEHERMDHLLDCARSTVLDRTEWRDLPISAGCATQADASDPSDLYRRAVLALLAGEHSGGPPRWYAGP